MKRLNPKTKKPFKKGEVRDDGWKFLGYRYGRIRKDGTYGEFWTSPENYAKRIKQEIIRKQNKRKEGRNKKGKYTINPVTGKRYSQGDTDKDGRVFNKYDSYILKNGYYAEMWFSNYDIFLKARIRGTYYAISKRASKKKLPFNITKQYITEIFPDDGICPVLKIKMDYTNDTIRFNSPSLDRISPKKGYVKGNVVWISMRANVIKQDANSDEIRKVADWLKKYEK